MKLYPISSRRRSLLSEDIYFRISSLGEAKDCTRENLLGIARYLLSANNRPRNQ